MANRAGALSTPTVENLLAAYNGERNAAARYAAFAIQAEKEGFAGIGSLFRAVAHSEQIHATNHARVLRKLGADLDVTLDHPEVRTTGENLLIAVQGEEDERDQMYPEFAAQARTDKCPEAVRSFEQAADAEAVHALMFGAALESMEDYRERTTYYVCTNCGWVSTGANFKRCIICHAPRESFDKIE